MSEPLLQFTIPASYVETMARLTPAELRYGFENSWLTAADIVQLSLRNVVPDNEVMQTIEELSLLLSDEFDKVPSLVDKLAVDPKPVWVYLALAWLHDHPADFDNPMQAVEMLYADFDYPSEMEPIVPFMPPPAGATPGMAGIEERWRSYLMQCRNRYLAGRTV
ncbi:DUF2247 family protein [Nocardia heshunensis]